MERFFYVRVVLLCLGHNLAWAIIEDAYFVVGKSRELRPPGTDAITSVEWRHKEDIAAEWTGEGAPVEYYRNFKGRTELDTKTGVLTLRDMTEAEAGLYSVEINGKRLDVQFSAQAIEEIQKVEVWEKPKGDDRELDCNANLTNVGPVTFWWDKVGNGSWFQWEQKLLIQNNETTERIETFSCKVRNPVGEKESKPFDNPFYKEPVNPAAYAVPITLVIAALVAGGAFFAHKKGLFEKFRSGQKVDTKKENADADTPLQGGDNATPSSANP